MGIGWMAEKHHAQVVWRTTRREKWRPFNDSKNKPQYVWNKMYTFLDAGAAVFVNNLLNSTDTFCSRVAEGKPGLKTSIIIIIIFFFIIKKSSVNLCLGRLQMIDFCCRQRRHFVFSNGTQNWRAKSKSIPKPLAVH